MLFSSLKHKSNFLKDAFLFLIGSHVPPFSHVWFFSHAWSSYALLWQVTGIWSELPMWCLSVVSLLHKTLLFFQLPLSAFFSRSLLTVTEFPFPKLRTTGDFFGFCCSDQSGDSQVRHGHWFKELLVRSCSLPSTKSRVASPFMASLTSCSVKSHY